MCREKTHKCYCGLEYSCTYPNWVCPTINEDEDSNTCDACMEKFAEHYNTAYDDEFLEDEEFDN